MISEFGISREQHNKLFIKQYKNPSGVLHFHSSIELYIVDEGELEVWINDQRAILKKGEISVALSYDSHCYRSVGDVLASLLIIPTFMCEEFLETIKNKRAISYFIRDPKATELIRFCYNEIKEEKLNNIKTLGYINVILGTVLENVNFTHISSDINTHLSSKLLMYINEHFKEDISLVSISTEFGYNSSYISRYFKSCFDVGINQYITLVRLKKAVMLMQCDSNNVTYCAFESGFNSMRTFYRAFYNEFKCTPSEYKAQMSDN